MKGINYVAEAWTSEITHTQILSLSPAAASDLTPDTANKADSNKATLKLKLKWSSGTKDLRIGVPQRYTHHPARKGLWIQQLESGRLYVHLDCSHDCKYTVTAGPPHNNTNSRLKSCLAGSYRHSFQWQIKCFLLFSCTDPLKGRYRQSESLAVRHCPYCMLHLLVSFHAVCDALLMSGEMAGRFQHPRGDLTYCIRHNTLRGPVYAGR